MLRVHLKDRQLLIPSNGTILSSLENASLPILSNCRSGFCGVCRIPVSGDVSNVIEPLGYTNDGEVLACCSQPIDDQVVDVHLP